jgi:nitroimidazol reductase NimA-like FMN-containing flavoprotein (pyridoxamine 5'-phosphate oxidase superfamily)
VKHVLLERRGDFVVTMYELDDDVCRDMLARCRFGRVGFDERGPAILPVNAIFADGAVLFRTAAGSSLDRNVVGQVVAFETDHIDPTGESGWSVLARGTATRVTDTERLASLAEVPVQPWAPGHSDVWIEIRPDCLTGRMIKRQRLGRRPGVAQLPPD